MAKAPPVPRHLAAKALQRLPMKEIGLQRRHYETTRCHRMWQGWASCLPIYMHAAQATGKADA